MTAVTFRHIIGGLLLLLAPVVSQAQELKVTLLGTGSPPPEIERFGPGTLVQAGTELLLFDVGRGVAQRLRQVNISLVDVDALFLTHLHADHTLGIPDLWLSRALDNRSAPLQVFGPEGTEDMLLNLRKAYQADSRMAAATVTHHVAQGMVYKQGGVTVTAFSVDHSAGPTPAFGYRIDYAGRSLVISGDTRPSENLVRFAQGADVLIHEVIAARPALLRQSERVRRTISVHTSPEEAGKIFDRVKPKLAVYTHVGLVGGPAARAALAAELIPRTRSTYAGPVEVGEDLMTLIIGDRVDARRFTAPVR
jgi:ribonuclease Z